MDLTSIRAALLRHYRRHARALPWRESSDPYRIWVSEIMLQQTQVKTVIPRFELFLQRYPSLAALAAAREAEVCEAWAGLGYYHRARNLNRAAQAVMVRHGGSLPRTATELAALPGIGRYVAGAIASMAFNERAACVDANVARILSRLVALAEPIDSPQGKRVLWQLAHGLVQCRTPSLVNQALMELGETVCLPRVPRCAACPLARWCQAARDERQGEFPRKSPRRQPTPLSMVVLWCETARGVWLRQRPLDGLWPGLWEPFTVEGGSAARVAKEQGVSISDLVTTVQVRLTHRLVTARVHRVRAPARWAVREGLVVFQDPLAAPLSGLGRKVIREMRHTKSGSEHEDRGPDAGAANLIGRTE